MHLIPEDELEEAEMGDLRRGSACNEVEELDQIKFHELLGLNLPDWYLVLLGVICTALLGALFPLMAVIFSGFLVVSYFSNPSYIFLMCFCRQNRQ